MEILEWISQCFFHYIFSLDLIRLSLKLSDSKWIITTTTTTWKWKQSFYCYVSIINCNWNSNKFDYHTYTFTNQKNQNQNGNKKKRKAKKKPRINTANNLTGMASLYFIFVWDAWNIFWIEYRETKSSIHPSIHSFIPSYICLFWLSKYKCKPLTITKWA